MSKRLFKMIQAALAVIMAVSILAGCTSNQSVKELYPLKSVSKDGSQESFVYWAKN
jgi:ABC-type uncharacterized transport system auxiliary subunit